MKYRWLYFNIGVGNLNCPYKVKVCTKCNRILIACEINFAKTKGGKYGFRGNCKKCNSQYYKNNKEHYKQYYEERREEIAEYKNQYYEEHREEILGKQNQYYEEHKEEKLKYQNQYYEKHKEERLKYQNQYRKDNPHIQFNNHNKRKKLKENQDNEVTNEQLHEMYKFFNGECAYSSIKIKKGVNNSIDHIVPLSKGGEHSIWNLVPMDKSYNSSKHTKDMETWYRQQEYFSEERLAKIYAWIEYAYSKWGTVED